MWKNSKASLHYCGSGDLDVYPSGTTASPRDVPCFPSDSALPPGGIVSFVVVAPGDPQQREDRKRRSHILTTLLKTAQDAFSESGTRKSERLLKVKANETGSKNCFLCTSPDQVEASYVFQKSDVSFKNGQDLPYDALVTLRDWRDGHRWKRPFEIHGPMNLIWLCPSSSTRAQVLHQN